jgi:hypothetical protein
VLEKEKAEIPDKMCRWSYSHHHRTSPPAPLSPLCTIDWPSPLAAGPEHSGMSSPPGRPARFSFSLHQPRPLSRPIQSAVAAE